MSSSENRTPLFEAKGWTVWSVSTVLCIYRLDKFIGQWVQGGHRYKEFRNEILPHEDIFRIDQYLRLAFGQQKVELPLEYQPMHSL